MDALGQTLRDRIARTERGTLSVKLKSLVGAFGFEARRRLRESSLSVALKALDDWGISYRLVAGRSANDYVTLWIDDDCGDGRAANEEAPRVVETTSARSEVYGQEDLAHGHEYRILSVQPPWAWAIIFGGKDVENRSWTTPFRGRILIHASSRKFSGEGLDEVRSGLAERCKRGTPIPVEFPRSQMLGTVEVVDCISDSDSTWAFPGEWHWVLKNPRPLARPIKGVDGKLNLWKWRCPE